MKVQVVVAAALLACGATADLLTSKSLSSKSQTLEKAPRVVHMPFRQKRSSGIPAHLRAKRDTVTTALGNARSLYYANASIGTPPQEIAFQVDTGSADIWMLSSTAAFCDGTTLGIPNCPFGTFDSAASRTAKLVDANGFEIQYVDGSRAQGDYFTDVFSIGGVSVQNQQMGLADRSALGQGIIGLAFPETEAICAQRQGPCESFPTLTQNMVSEGLINTQAYSLWLNDLGASEGSLLFGGVDTDKYVGDLVQLPLQRDAFSGTYTSFTVAWTGLTISTPDGTLDSTSFFPAGSASQPAILDSGTTIMLLPEDTTQKIFDQVGAFVSQEIGIAVAPCYFADTNITLDFQFGGSDGPTVKVQLGEFLLDLGTDATGEPLRFQNGDVACQFGIMSGGQGAPILFGDTFLRSAYVVYDLDNRAIAIAQTDFNATSSNVREITTDGIPNVASTASAVSASQTATGIPAPGSGDGTMGGGTSGDSGDSGDSLSGDSASTPPLASFTSSAPPSASDAEPTTSGSSGAGSGGAASPPSPSGNGASDSSVDSAAATTGAAARLCVAGNSVSISSLVLCATVVLGGMLAGGALVV